MNSKQKIYQKLCEMYPNAECELKFENEYQLIVAVMLSAQCTDKKVNQITPLLFKKYPNFYALARADANDLESVIRPCGLFRAKAKNLIAMAGEVTQKHSGVLPCDRKELELLPGVGRKTANVILALNFNVPAIAVDTHVFRTSSRLGLCDAKNVLSCEEQLMQSFNQSDWINLHFVLIKFGRELCKSKGSLCDQCPFADRCTKA